MRIEVSPRLERVSRHYTRLHWKEVLQGYILGEKEFNLSEVELGALRALDDRSIAVRELIQRMGFPAQRARHYVPMLRRLIEVGAMDLQGLKSAHGRVPGRSVAHPGPAPAPQSSGNADR